MLSELISTFTRMALIRFVGEIVPCELCGGTDHEIVGRRDRYGHRLQTVLCRGCGLVFTNPMPTQAEVDRYYADDYRKTYHNAYEPRKKAIRKALKGARHRFSSLAPLLRPGSVVLDVGASGGEFVHEAQSQGCVASGIEPNRGFAAFAQRHYGVPIQIGGWEEAKIEPESVDVITANHVVEHFRHPLAALRRFHGWLKPGGHFFISVPEVESPQRTPYGRFHFAHLYNFNHASLEMMALRAGFGIDRNFDARSTTLILRKLPEPAADWLRHPDNYANLSRYFREHTNRHYFLSATPYRRWFQRMWRLGSNMVAATFVSSNSGRPAR